jgi:transcription elongation GreA/GreB family factor
MLKFGSMEKILLHEKKFLIEALDDLRVERLSLADAKADAQGDSYDWHDNAPLDVIEQHLKQNTRQINQIENFLKISEIESYPEESDKVAKLGSFVLAQDSYGIMPFVIVGQHLAGSKKYEEVWEIDPINNPDHESLLVITPSSPLGAAALGLTIEDDAKYTVDNRNFSLRIASIDQAWVKNNFASE